MPTNQPPQDDQNQGDVEQILVSDAVEQFDPFLPQRERLKLAKWILGVLALLVVLSWVALWFAPPEAGKSIFDFAKTTIPPLVTLIIGAYFNRSSDDSNG